MLLLDDNARPHSAVLTQEKLAQMYSPDLSPCKYHMFRPLKEVLGRQHFDDDEQVENFVCKSPQMRLHSMTQE